MSEKLAEYLPKKHVIGQWIDVLTELLFIQATLIRNEVSDSLKKTLAKINAIIEEETNRGILIGELSGQLEAIKENKDILKAKLNLQKAEEGGNVIRESIAI